MHFLTKVLRKIEDEAVHRVFLRYGKGEYEGPTAEITLTRAEKVKVRSTYLYQDLIASVFIRLVPTDYLSISGIVLAYETLDEELASLGIEAEPFTKKPRTKLVQTKISGQYTKSQLSSLYDEIGENAYIFCNLTTDQGWSHKSKAKIPSAQKEAPLKEQLKFSTTTVPAGTPFVEQLVKEIAPDFLDEIPASFSSLQLQNNYVILDLEFPPDMNQLTSKEIRLKTKRKGLLYRTLITDDVEFHREHQLIA